MLGFEEVAKRALALILCAWALARLPDHGAMPTAAMLAAAMAIILVTPQAPRPAKAETYNRLTAIAGLDILGLLLTGLFIAIPVWADAAAHTFRVSSSIDLHPSALVTWPLAAVSGSLLWFAARNAAFWLKLDNDGFTVHRLGHGARRVEWQQVKSAAPTRQGLPVWLRKLVPALVASGHYSAGGSIMLARDSTGIRLELSDGSLIDIGEQGFERPMRMLKRALTANGYLPTRGKKHP